MTFPGCPREGERRALPRTRPQPAGQAAPPPHSLLHDQREAVLALEGVIELDQVHVAQLVHDVDLVLHILLTEPEGTGV